jgi:hypothetical protein
VTGAALPEPERGEIVQSSTTVVMMRENLLELQEPELKPEAFP